MYVTSRVTVFRTMAFTEEFIPKDLIKAESKFGRVGALGGEYHMILRGQTGFVAIRKPGREVS